ncbi:MAG: hypothetical protein COA79_20225 [Planctomycetota bacterium]|nr:MAG: hypothetical protein COA79_20225 [Planctomycetota bacterium]
MDQEKIACQPSATALVGRGKTQTSPKEFLSALNMRELSAPVREYIERELLGDISIDLLSETDPEFIEVKELIEKNFPKALPSVGAALNKEDYATAISGLQVMAATLEGEKKQEYQDVIDGLKIIMDMAPVAPTEPAKPTASTGDYQWGIVATLNSGVSKTVDRFESRRLARDGHHKFKDNPAEYTSRWPKPLKAADFTSSKISNDPALLNLLAKHGAKTSTGYGDMTPQQVWDSWDQGQKNHFLQDHRPVDMSHEQALRDNYANLVLAMREKLKKHLDSPVYKDGGKTSSVIDAVKASIKDALSSDPQKDWKQSLADASDSLHTIDEKLYQDEELYPFDRKSITAIQYSLNDAAKTSPSHSDWRDSLEDALDLLNELTPITKGGKATIPENFKKALVSQDYVYFVDPDEGDESGNTIMVSRLDGHLVSDNYMASDSLAGTIADNDYSWLSTEMEYNVTEIKKEAERFTLSGKLFAQDQFSEAGDTLTQALYDTFGGDKGKIHNRVMQLNIVENSVSLDDPAVQGIARHVKGDSQNVRNAINEALGGSLYLKDYLKDGGRTDYAAKCPVGRIIQSVMFDKTKFSKAQAKAWAKSHSFKYGKVLESKNYWRARQKPSTNFIKKSIKTTTFTDGIKATHGCLQVRYR